MTIATQDYAYLSSMTYQRWQPGDILSEADSGQAYRVIEVIDDASGYYGVIFQNDITKEYVVSHCGTEFGTDNLRDLYLTDSQMALLEINQQKSAAEFLVSRAVDLSAENPNHPAVSVTGHSLGGSLAQITAVKYGLHGETFNAYGAADLIGLSAGNATIINHVRATDMVSAAGKHVGEVIVYATERDVELVIPFNDSVSIVSSFNSLIDRFNPDETHAITQFYGDDAITNFQNFNRYEEDAAWYDTYRSTLRAAALGAESALIAIEAIGKYLPNMNAQEAHRVGFSSPLFVPTPQRPTHGNGGPRPTLRGFACDEIHAGDAQLLRRQLREA